MRPSSMTMQSEAMRRSRQCGSLATMERVVDEEEQGNAA